MPSSFTAALRAAASLALALGCAAGARASAAAPVITVDKVFGKVAGWSIGYSGNTGGCLAAASYGDGTTVWFGFGGTTNSAFVAFTNPRWQSIQIGQNYDIRIFAGGGRDWYGSFAGFERNGQKGIYTSGLKDKFVSDLADAGQLDLSLGGKRIASLSLVGSLDALSTVMACQKDHDGDKPDVASSDDGGGAVKPSSSGGESHDHSSQGTGFFVSDKGHVLTNHHVIDGCSDITVTRVGAPATRARLVAKDATNDLAVLSTDAIPTAVPALSMRARIGEAVFAYGYPLNGLLATTGNFTIGNVTATEGLGDDTRQLQISAPVQPGNSGGPLVDDHGHVVGVIVSKLNALKMASITSDLAQNVNFAIKSGIALSFLEANGIDPPIAAKAADAMAPETIAERAREFTVRVDCR